MTLYYCSTCKKEMSSADIKVCCNGCFYCCECSKDTRK